MVIATDIEILLSIAAVNTLDNCSSLCLIYTYELKGQMFDNILVAPTLTA